MGMAISGSKALWNEKYRPLRLQEILGQEEAIAALRAFVEKGILPDLLLLGPPGAAKTTSALCLLSELYRNNLGASFLEMNSSGKDAIATIKEFANSRPVQGGVPFKAMLLRQLDVMDPSAQQSLRRIVEMTVPTCRFIFTAQHKDRVIGALQSRCSILLFRPYPPKILQSYIAKILESEGIKFDTPGLRRIVEHADGNLRLAIDLAQTVAMAKGKVTAIAVYQITECLYPQDVKSLYELASGGDFEGSRRKLRELLVAPGYSGHEIIRQIQREILKSELDDGEKGQLVDVAADVDMRIAQGGEVEVQISALLARLTSHGKGSVPQRSQRRQTSNG